MGILLKVLAYGAVGMILLFLNFVFIARIRAEFREDIPADPIIGPFRIIGRQADDKTGEVMAELLVARVDSLGDEITTTFHSLTKLLPKTGVGAARSRRSSINEPEEQPVTNQMRLNVLEPPADVRLSVAGVEVGGFIPWLQRYAVADRMLHVSVNYQKDKIIAAATTSSSRRSIWLELPSDESELKTPNADAIENAPLDVVTELAYALQKQKFEVIYPSLRPLDLHQFRNLLALLRKAAQLNQRTAAQQATESDYEAILAEIDKFLVHPEIAQWPSFLELAGQVAERAGRFGRATAFLTSAKNFAETKQEKALLDQRISEVLGAKQAHLAEGNEELLRTVRTLGLDKSIAVKRRPRVAVLGMPPPMPAAVSYPVIGQYSVPKNSAIATHTLRVLDVVKRLAPNADLAIVSLDLPAVDNGAFSSEKFIAGLNAAAVNRPDILIIPYGPLAQPMVSALEKVIASDVIVVLAAGNDARSPAPPADRALAKQLLVVAATDTNGRPAEFSSRGPDVVWAPGVHFPVSVDDEHWEFFSGTTFSTAAIAALAAQVVAATGESGPKVVAAIQKAAKDGGGDAPTPTLEGSIKAMKP